MFLLQYTLSLRQNTTTPAASFEASVKIIRSGGRGENMTLGKSRTTSESSLSASLSSSLRRKGSCHLGSFLPAPTTVSDYCRALATPPRSLYTKKWAKRPDLMRKPRGSTSLPSSIAGEGSVKRFLSSAKGPWPLIENSLLS